MKQIITGPFGCVAYHNTVDRCDQQYPALNIPSRDFACRDMPLAANHVYAANVVPMNRRVPVCTAVALFGISAKR